MASEKTPAAARWLGAAKGGRDLLRRAPSHRHVASTFACGVLIAACGHAGERRFPLKDPFWQDTDRRPIAVPCEKRPTEKEPAHVACAPEVYVSPLIWDAADNSAFRPLAKLFAVDPPREAVNVNALDEVPDSAWFTNRIGVRKPSRDELLRGACSLEEVLDGASAPAGSWVIDQGKANGASPGFRIRVGGKRKYMLKTDSREQPERPSAASAIGAAIYHAVGFNTSCEQVVFVSRPAFTLQPGLKVTDNTGITKPFDEKALDAVLAQATPRENTLRLQASAWLPGYLLGPFRYEGRRSDDDNDAIAHEDRRDLRGARLVAAWLNHFDAREQNTMDSWIASAGPPDSSPGYVRHYYLDTSDCFGSEWNWDGISRRLGRSYLLDWGNIGLDFVTLGIPVRSWERAERTPGMELFGYFDVRDFDPEEWKNEYPNPAFARATERDNAWMARILARFERDDIDALVGLGKFSEAHQARYLADVLEGRLRRILARYLGQLSPLADVRVTEPARVCATDLARRRAVWEEPAFHYTARWQSDADVRSIAVETRPNGEICFDLPRVETGNPAMDKSYVVVSLANGVSRYPLRAHFYDAGSLGYRLVGLERRDEP